MAEMQGTFFDGGEQENQGTGEPQPIERLWRVTRVALTCAVCGKQFEVQRHRAKTTTCCSLECRRIYCRKPHKVKRKPAVLRACLVCGKEFKVWQHRIETAQFCSRECRQKGPKKPKHIDKPEIITQQPHPDSPIFCDLTGKQFSRLTALYYVGKWTSHTKLRHWWWCRCTCGKELAVSSISLIHDNKRSCGCLVTGVDANGTNKTCTRCGKSYPATSEYFNRSRKVRLGLFAVCKECTKVEHRIRSRQHRRKLRMEVLRAYSCDPPTCACCGEAHEEFLEIDHINGGGVKDFKKYGFGKFYARLKKLGFPPGYQVLCANCNKCKGKLGYCVHRPDKVYEVRMRGPHANKKRDEEE